MTPLFQRLPYHSDSADLFETIRHLQWPVFLDSGRPMVSQGRYDILSASPYLTLVTRGEETEICDRNSRQLSLEDPLALLRRHLSPPLSPNHPEMPFIGGAIGYFSYDLARRWLRLPALAQQGETLPQMVIALYDWALVVDHEARASWLVSLGRDRWTAQVRSELVQGFSHPVSRSVGSFRLSSSIQSNLSRAAYADRFARIQHYIREGDCYQVNFAQRFSGVIEGDSWSLYRHLRRVNPAPFSAFMDYPFATILSTSPERFLRLHRGRVQTRPIKGTRPRSGDPHRDGYLRSSLATSEKDRAENLMIVDLLRNDLGQVCKTGSVKVPVLFDIESFAQVHHMVSTVSGELDHGRDALDLVRACFPGGSITGAPKLRAMEIIDELEEARRGLYCGSIAYIGMDGSMDSNIAIRSLVMRNRSVDFWAGGGIVADSCEEAEYQESLDKASAIFTALGAEPP
ncbi:MAG: aminodeoxychorismate synthase component I [Candidatus Thiodiazotropha sp. (ex Epidulcina cf. delphinae)]|nr:aminodeoxychorismate synthase component I [Candidatus Thiodiazotropha sp. (ex Epidulcina cf. delphinae)]